MNKDKKISRGKPGGFSIVSILRQGSSLVEQGTENQMVTIDLPIVGTIQISGEQLDRGCNYQNKHLHVFMLVSDEMKAEVAFDRFCKYL